MTVLIISSLGATKNYPDQEMLRQSFGAFLNSLRRQSDKDFCLFLSYHDRPDVFSDDQFIFWCPVSGDKNQDTTVTPIRLPSKLSDPGDYQTLPYDCKITDMGRKTWTSMIEAIRWANGHDMKEFWVLRMDSDDLLSQDMIHQLHRLQQAGVQAVYNRTCHMFDPKRKEIAVHKYPYSTTCNALLFRIVDQEYVRPNWFYLCTDHTLFVRHVRNDRIPFVEINYTLCILTNTGNSISGRPEIDKEKNVTKILLTNELRDRYGLNGLERC